MDYFETQDIPCGRTLTYQEFFERFNKIARGHHACPATEGGETIGVAIVLSHNGSLKALLGLESRIWHFNDSSFDYEELGLMTQLAANMPEFRGGISNGQSEN